MNSETLSTNIVARKSSPKSFSRRSALTGPMVGIRHIDLRIVARRLPPSPPDELLGTLQPAFEF